MTLTDEQTNDQEQIDSGQALSSHGYSLTRDVREDSHDDSKVDILHYQDPHQYDVKAHVTTTCNTMSLVYVINVSMSLLA